jgi:hypothetical protein
MRMGRNNWRQHGGEIMTGRWQESATYGRAATIAPLRGPLLAYMAGVCNMRKGRHDWRQHGGDIMTGR